MLSLLTLVLLLSVTLGPVQGQEYRPDYRDLLPGSYCASRPGARRGSCCPSRIDACSVPIRDTLCYCDQFCDRGASGDCCPDYFTFCLGETAPDPITLGCPHNGANLAPGDDVQENCNTCKCMQLSETSAELMCDMAQCLVQPDLINDINAQRYYGWTASNYSQFWGKKMATGLQYLLGTRYPNDMMNTMYPITKIYDPNLLPRSFDARDKPEWQGKIGPVVDQGWCGASWAVSTSTTAADRLAIQGGVRSELSKQNVVDCASSPGEDGCLGGNLDRAWNYLRTYGVAEEGCYPYESDMTRTKGQCKMPRRSRRPFQLTCTNGTTVELKRYQLKGTQPPYRIASREEDIMHELYYSGPVQAIMKVHEDFFSYRSGVYRTTGLRPSLRTAYHSVRILGWGEETGVRGEQVRYWIVANSWGEQWGENGLFRIVRGQNEADIETFVVGSWAKPSRRARGRYRNYRRSRRHHGSRRHHKAAKQ